MGDSLSEQIVEDEHLRALTDDVPELVTILHDLFQEEIFLLEVLLFQSILDDDFDLLHLEGLRDVIVGPFLHGLDGGVSGGIGGDHDDDRFGGGSLDLLQHRDAVHLWHPDVEEDQIEDIFVDELQDLVPVSGQT